MVMRSLAAAGVLVNKGTEYLANFTRSLYMHRFFIVFSVVVNMDKRKFKCVIRYCVHINPALVQS